MITVSSSDRFVKRRGAARSKVILSVILAMLVVAALVVSALVWKLDHAMHAAAPSPSEPVKPVVRLDKHVNILVLGSDARTKDDPGRSDSIMLVGLDPVTKKITIMSIPRDTRVSIPGHGIGKINATTNKDVYSNGGIALLEETIGGLVPGIHVDYYVRMNFAGFAKVIDALGGVTLDVEERMVYRAADTSIDLKPGVQHLDGDKALQYARFRSDGVGDFGSWGGEEYGRVARQKKLLKAVIAQTTSIRNAWRLPKVISVVQEAVVTDLSSTDMLRLGMTFKDATDKDVTTVVFPGIPKYVDGTSYVVPYTGPMKDKVAPLFKDAPVVAEPPTVAPNS
jgi:LCP family protein required for cell wall assembly